MSFAPAEHPERFVDVATLRDRPGLLIAEIAGRDSVAAALLAIRERDATTMLPTSVATSTEYGDEDAPVRAAEHLAELAGEGVEVLPAVRIGSPKLWAALSGRYAEAIRERFGIHSPCLACHLYMHLARLPLSWALGDVPIVAGERDSHDGRIKLSQTTLGIDASVRVLARAGVELLEPVRHLRDASQIRALVGDQWGQGDRQLCCVHSGNYAGLDGTVTYDEVAYARYLHGFMEPAANAIIDAWRSDPDPDYGELVRGVLEGPDAA
jgi:hypothetical protein